MSRPFDSGHVNSPRLSCKLTKLLVEVVRRDNNTSCVNQFGLDPTGDPVPKIVNESVYPKQA